MTGKFRPDWVILLKFQKRKYLEEFREKGLLYLNPQSHFTKLEADAVRSDRFEATDRIIQPKDLKQMTIENNIDGRKIVVPGSDFVGPILINFGKRSCNIYCMFAVTKPSVGPFVDERNFAFGDSFILVLNTQEFFDRFCAAATAAEFGYEYRLVEYYDVETHSSETGAFRKPNTFAFQNEFRFVLRPGVVEPIRLFLGDLTDITTPIHPLADINRLVEFGVDSL